LLRYVTVAKPRFVSLQLDVHAVPAIVFGIPRKANFIELPLALGVEESLALIVPLSVDPIT
jgi:hypothetical protein